MIQNYQIDTLWGKELLSYQAALDDIYTLENILESNYSYFSYNTDTIVRGFTDLKNKLAKSITRGEFALQIHSILSNFHDPHTIINNIEFTPGVLPFRIQELNGRYIALNTNGSLYDQEYPFITAIDEQSLLDWRKNAIHLQKFGSPQYTQLSESFALTRINQIHLNQGRSKFSKYAEVTLIDVQNNQKHLAINLQPFPTFPKRPLLEKIHTPQYLLIKIAKMFDDAENLVLLEQLLIESKNYPSLILDFRGNSGGSRHILHLISEYLINDSSIITNVANFRLPPNEPEDKFEGHLEDRFMYPKRSKHFNNHQKKLIDIFLTSFKPSWLPSFGNFTENNYFFINGSTKKIKNKPIIILQNEFCASATDILLSSLKGIEGIVTIGQPSTGASGRACLYELSQTGIDFQASTIVSYQKSGQLFDRIGVEPDITVENTLESYINGIDLALNVAEDYIEANRAN